MHQEKEKQAAGCTAEYCARPEVNENNQLSRPSAEEIRMINAALQQDITIEVPGTKKD